ncbi:MAG: SDR family oxidoreductase [Bacteroidetes bacterium]|nr:SDR family oxidoreductase [Bacteroidota bacterium]
MSHNLFANRIVCITGSSRGVGKQLVDYFIGQGASVVGISRGVDERVIDNFYPMQADISNPEELKKVFSFIKSKFNKLDILINNAGISHSGQALFLSTEKVRSMIDINFLGAFLVTKEAAKLMMKNKYGRIVNIGSICSTVEPFGASVYSATKAAIHSLSNSLAQEFASFNITSNTLALSPFPTDMLNTISQADIDWYLNEQKIKRLAEINDITNVIEFFCLEQSSFITAQFIQLGGISS